VDDPPVVSEQPDNAANATKPNVIPIDLFISVSLPNLSERESAAMACCQYPQSAGAAVETDE